MSPATVTQASPLLVRLDGTATAVPAKALQRGSTYTPALNARVAVEQIVGRLYVIGDL